MAGIKGVRDLGGNRERLEQCERTVGNAIGERLTLDELEDEATHALTFCSSVDRCDMRMIDRRENTCLPLEPREPLRIVAKGIRQDLDGDIAMKLAVASSVDLAHPTCADGRYDLVRTNSRASCQGHRLNMRIITVGRFASL